MNNLLTKKLVIKYPKLFKNIHGNPLQTVIAWGIACDDGWLDIIDEFCADVMKINPNPPAFMDIKEKFGTIRIYMEKEPDDISQLIEKAFLKSAVTCEVCGKPGEIKDKSGWVKTLCEKDAKELGYE